MMRTQDRIIYSNGLARMNRPPTLGEMKRGFTGKVTSDGRALQDVLADDYTLLDLRGDCDAGPLLESFRATGAPLDVLHLNEERVRSVYGASVFLLRPDLHIVWRGNDPPANPEALTALATGLALLPLVISGNRPGHEIEYPLAVVILGGLATSTLLNLFLLPPLYLLFGRRAALAED